MRSFLPAVLILAAGCSPAAGSGDAPVAAQNEAVESVDASETIAEVAAAVDLGDKPAQVTIRLGDARDRALAIARDPQRALVLRVEGVSVSGPPNVVYEVFVAGQGVGVLSFYGAEVAQGDAASTFAIDDAAARALTQADSLLVTFRPQGRIEEGREVPPVPTERVRFTRLRLVEEKLPQ